MAIFLLFGLNNQKVIVEESYDSSENELYPYRENMIKLGDQHIGILRGMSEWDQELEIYQYNEETNELKLKKVIRLEELRYSE